MNKLTIACLLLCLTSCGKPSKDETPMPTPAPELPQTPPPPNLAPIVGVEGEWRRCDLVYRGGHGRYYTERLLTYSFSGNNFSFAIEELNYENGYPGDASRSPTCQGVKNRRVIEGGTFLIVGDAQKPEGAKKINFFQTNNGKVLYDIYKVIDRSIYFGYGGKNRYYNGESEEKRPIELNDAYYSYRKVE